MPGPSHHVVSADGTAIALERVTDGARPLVTFPGATAPRGIWGPTAAGLDGRFAVWLADRRGKGDSGDTEPYSFEREYEDVRTVAAWFGGEAVVAAHSSGAVCVLGAAASGELPAAGLVLYEPPWPLPGRADDTETLDAMDARLAAGDPEGALEIGMLRLVQAPPAAVEGMKRAPSWPQRVAAVHTWTREGRELVRMPEGTDALRGVGLPTVMLLGEQSAEHLHASTRAVADALTDAVVVDLPGQAHAALMTAPDLVAAAILRHAG
ncbi:pimeloyl-ACP methyl ester carboxylesterase [Actinomycetospora succinea]|uniref:Pimeloyl-ACP methyl ester carboxylesterase n=1 Tax=Actinomycetospora succinea TaxID=663603 RepID=A0A4R6UPG2_9PSEU|nr:alpha/beta hydrolase [Actinomycetospora succinea]TDQ47353.1 pimeloyl-ACP methyl ester carboxylesterase [Actinomycetospora succinea]